MTVHAFPLLLRPDPANLRPRRAPKDRPLKLTRTLVDKTQAAAKDVWLWDAVLPSFGLRVRPGGHKTYVVRYRTTAGTQRKLTIGRADIFATPDEAREKARDVLRQAKEGKDAVTDRREKRNAPTVKDLEERYTKLHAAKLKDGTRRNYEILWRLHILPELGSMKVADVAMVDISRLHAEKGDRPVNANRMLEVLSKAFSIAEDLGWRPPHSNPCAKVPAYPERERQRILTTEEIKTLLASLDRRPISNLIRLLLLSGLRVAEWSTSRWEWIDFDRGTLTLPDTKTGGRVVHLGDHVLEVLRNIDRKDGDEWIIPTATGTAMRWPFEHWEPIREKLGLEEVRLHDLRHTVGSLAHMAGLTQKEVAEMLGHRQLRTTERYIHTYDDQKRIAANRAASRILGFMNGEANG